MGAYKFYNPTTQQWEIIKSKSIIKDDGSLEYTPDDIKNIDDKLSGIQAGAQVNTVTSVSGKIGAVVVSKSDVGLSNVDNIKQATKTEFDAHKADKANPHNTNKTHVGLSEVDNIKQMPIAGSTFTGITTAYSNTSYTVRQMRNIILSTSNAVLSSMQDGDIWIKYK